MAARGRRPVVDHNSGHVARTFVICRFHSISRAELIWPRIGVMVTGRWRSYQLIDRWSAIYATLRCGDEDNFYLAFWACLQ